MKPIRINHKIAIRTANSLYLGDKSLRPFSPEYCGVSTGDTGVRVIVAVGEGVETGKIRVISGREIRVVVAVSDGVIVGV